MRETIEIVNTQKIDATPAVVAHIFWNMGDIEQAEFFGELAKLTKANFAENHDSKTSYVDEYGTMQWCYMTSAVRKLGGDAAKMYLAFCSFAYDYWDHKWEL